MSNFIISLALEKEQVFAATLLASACIAIILTTLFYKQGPKGLKPFITLLMGGLALITVGLASWEVYMTYQRVAETNSMLSTGDFNIQNVNDTIIISNTNKTITHSETEFKAFKDSNLNDIVELSLLH